MENVKLVIGYLAATTSVLTTALKDGFQTKDMKPIGLQMFEIPEVMAAWPHFKAEWKARTAEGLADLKAHFKENLKLTDTDLEAKIERVVEWLTDGIDIFDDLFGKSSNPTSEQQ